MIEDCKLYFLVLLLFPQYNNYAHLYTQKIWSLCLRSGAVGPKFWNNAKIMKKSLTWVWSFRGKKLFEQMRMFFGKGWRSTHQVAMSRLSVLVNTESRWNLVIPWVFLSFQSGILKQDCRLDLDELGSKHGKVLSDDVKFTTLMSHK